MLSGGFQLQETQKDVVVRLIDNVNEKQDGPDVRDCRIWRMLALLIIA